MESVRVFSGSILGVRSLRTAPGTFIFTERNAKHSFTGSEAYEIVLPRKSAYGVGDGMPVWILATRTVASFAEHRPELLQGTFIDITEQKQADARLRDRRNNAFPTSAAESENPKAAELFQRLAALLGRASQALQPHNLIRLERAEMQECLLALEEIKMVMSRLEILHLLGK
jgi:hypothetical protein